jgi:PPE-repeat protein
MIHSTIAQALAPFAPPAPTVDDLQAQVNDLQEELNFYLEALTYIYDNINNHTIYDVNQVKMICARVLP